MYNVYRNYNNQDFLYKICKTNTFPPMGYPNHAMTNPYAGMPGVRVSPHAGPPYGQRFG
jgi:hypothetical protein